MSVFSRLRGMKKRWWVLLGAPVGLALVAGIFLMVRWLQYRAYQNVDLVAILPDDAQAAVRVSRFAERWPGLSRSPALLAVAKAMDPKRGEGPLTLDEAAGLLGGDIPEGISESRIMSTVGRDLAAGVVYGGGKTEVIAATRVPFSYFLFASIIKRQAPPEIAIEFRGDIMIVGTRPDWVATAAARAETGERGRVALELEAAAPEGEPAFWIDLAATRKDPKFGPKLKEAFNSVPVREALFMLDLDAARACSGRFVTEGNQARLEGTILLSQKLDARLTRMYAMPDGDPGIAAMLPPNTCYATGAKAEAETSWEFMKELTRPAKGAGKRKTVSEAFGDFVSNIYLFLHDGIESSEEHGSAKDFRAMFDRDVAFALTSEKEEPFVGLTLLARVKDGPQAMDKLYKFFEWLHEGQKELKLKSETYRDLDVRVLEGTYEIMGKGTRPAFAVVNGVLVLTSSYDTLKLIADVALAGAPGFVASPAGADLRAAAPSDGPAWAYADVHALRAALVAMKDAAARTQVEREIESTGAAKIRARITEKIRKMWEATHPGEPWVELAHLQEVDDGYHAWVRDEEARTARDMADFAGRLGKMAGLAFVVRQGKGEILEWRAVLAAER
ncbi:MAG: hypothetical protein K8T20_19255 [Planctomycetes bacterium]|nr:hypothetical protein [Planctomycetota bacterium]